MELECSRMIRADRGYVQARWPELTAFLRNTNALASMLFLSRLYILITAERPRFDEASFDSDAMGGLEFSVSLSSPSGGLRMAYEQTLRKSWSSVERIAFDASFSCAKGVSLSWDLDLSVSSLLKLTIEGADAELLDSVVKLASEYFEEIKIAGSA